MNVSPNLILSTVSVVAISVGILAVIEAFKEKDTEYEGGEGDKDRRGRER